MFRRQRRRDRSSDDVKGDEEEGFVSINAERHGSGTPGGNPCKYASVSPPSSAVDDRLSGILSSSTRLLPPRFFNTKPTPRLNHEAEQETRQNNASDRNSTMRGIAVETRSGR